jgi:tryptophan halogenase
LFARDSWLAVLVGQGIAAAGYDRLADALPLSALEERLSEFRNRIQANVDDMPAHDAFIANYAQAIETTKPAEAVA